jgi:4-amino-4-deoxy-L-arabinose transferase-like glycosyltransferase
MIGSGRVFGYDSAVTFANFIATPSMLDAFAVHAQQPTISLAAIAGNDHVLLSVFSHAVFSVTGIRSEAVYRFLPALAAGGAVGLTAGALVRRFGAVAASCAGVCIATNPLFVENSRDLLGYSLAALFGVLATLMFFKGRDRSRKQIALYGLLLGLAIASHVFAGLVLVAHVAWLVARRSWHDLRRLAPAWIGALAFGLAANAYILWLDLSQRDAFPPRLFDPTFARDLVFYLVGAPDLLTIGLWLSTAGLGLWVLRREPWLWPAVGVVAFAVTMLWLVVRPAYLYPRFFTFLVPGLAVLIAAAIQRWKVLAPVVLLGAAAAAAIQAPYYTADSLALRQAAAVVDRANPAASPPSLIHSDEQ